MPTTTDKCRPAPEPLPSVSSEQRYTAEHPCPGCGGHEGKERGEGARCLGYVCASGRSFFCRNPVPGALADDLDCFKHLFRNCPCGEKHGRCRPPIAGASRSQGPPDAALVDAYYDKKRRYPTAEAAIDAALRVMAGKRGGDVKLDIVRWFDADETVAEVRAVVHRPDGSVGKDIRPIHLFGGSWYVGKPQTYVPLYRPHELPEDLAEPVILTEGAKCADAARALGIPATAAFGGASAGWATDWAPLRGRDLIVALDNDAKGEKFGPRVTNVLRDLAPPARLRLLRFPELPPKGDVADWAEIAGHGRDELLALIDQTAEEVPLDASETIDVPAPGLRVFAPHGGGGGGGVGGASRTGPPADDRLAIELTDRTDEALDAFSAVMVRRPDVFLKGQVLGEVAPGDLGSPAFFPIHPDALLCEAPRWARFYIQTEKGERDVQAPARMIKALVARKHWEGARRLDSCADVPWVNEDGRLPAPGYDAEHRVLLADYTGLGIHVPERPTRDDAQRAAQEFQGVFGEFPFQDDCDRAANLLAAITLVQRAAIPSTVPGFAYIGTQEGLGKGLLINCLARIATGANAPERGYRGDTTEVEKMVLALAIDGVRLVFFDNLRSGSSYGNSALDSSITSECKAGRILGKSRDSGPVPLRTCWFLSGNDISPSADAHRRWLPVRFKTDVDTYDRQQIRFTIRDLKSHVLAERGRLLSLLYTILRAHALAGRPVVDGATLGSFEAWDLQCRQAVIWATGVDPRASMRQVAESSPERAAWARFVRSVLGSSLGFMAKSGGFTAKELMAKAALAPTFGQGLRPGQNLDDAALAEALDEAPKHRGPSLDSRALTDWFKASAKWAVDGWRIEQRDVVRGNRLVWVFRQTNAGRPEGPREGAAGAETELGDN